MSENDRDPASAAQPLRWWRIEFSLGCLDRIQMAQVRMDLVPQVEERCPDGVRAQPAQVQDEPIDPHGLVHTKRLRLAARRRLDGAQVSSRALPGRRRCCPTPRRRQRCQDRQGASRISACVPGRVLASQSNSQGDRMNTSTTRPSNAASADADLAEQARPGHGIPSQDPTPAAP